MERLFRPVHPFRTILLGLLMLGLMHAAWRLSLKKLELETLYVSQFQKTQDDLFQARERFSSLRELKDSDTARFRAGFSGQALSRKTLFEAALSLHEERRLLEKQLEIMTTRLEINPALQRVFLFRGDQPLQSYLISYIPPRAFGNASDAIPPTVRIVSKERFAHPERGQSTEIHGSLQWTPPQVGTSVRSNALGEFVIFTNSPLILHGPPVNPDDHDKFPHVCLGLDRDSARKLYRATFIGTRIVIVPTPAPQP